MISKPLKCLAVVAVFAVGIFAGTLIAAGGHLSHLSGPAITAAMISQLPQMSTEGYEEALVSVEDNLIQLHSGCRRLTMVTNELQTYSISSGINNQRATRPMTHDIIQDMMEMFGMDVIMVRVDRFSQGAYFARLVIRQGSRILDMDCRPSDAIAVAVRFNAPVYVNSTLMDARGEIVC